MELNQSNGLAMTEDEIRRFVDGAVLEGQHAELRTLSRMTGVSEQVARWVAETQFKARAKREGIETSLNALPPAHGRLSRRHVWPPCSVRSRGSPPTPGSRSSTSRRSCSQTNAASSESDALAVVGAEREMRTEEIRAVGFGVQPRRTTVARRARPSTSAAWSASTSRSCSTWRPRSSTRPIQRMRLLRDRLDEVVARAQQEWDLDAAGPTPSGRRRRRR